MTAGHEQGPEDPETPEFDTRGFVTVVGRDYLEMTENGCGAVIATAAGPDRVYCVPLRLSEYKVRTSWEQNGESRAEVRERNAEDQDDIDNAIEDYLADAGLPLRPRGFRWFIEVPPGIADAEAFRRAINRRFAELTDQHPDGKATARVLTAIMHELYATTSRNPDG